MSIFAWLEFEAARVSSAEGARQGRTFEIALIHLLADSPNPGMIGIQARPSLKRMPSSIADLKDDRVAVVPLADDKASVYSYGLCRS
jgi:hypothetical protein